MNHQQILEKAIQKAIDGEWKPIGAYNGMQFIASIRPSLLHFTTADDSSQYYCDIEHIIFNHEFAKALWGDRRGIEKYGLYTEGQLDEYISVEEYESLPDDEKEDKGWQYYAPFYKHSGWQYHLQQMVIADDPIKYLGDNI